MATHGRVSTERLQYYFAANEITNATKKRAILITACSPSTFHLLRSLVQPQTPSDLSYDELVQVMKEHYQPKPSVIVQQYKFYSRNREEGESISDYIAALKALAEYCCLGDSLNDVLRDRLVCGVQDGGIQKRFLQESDLSFKEAFEIAQGIEAAVKGAQALQVQCNADPQPQTVQKIKSATSSRFKQPATTTCYWCGANHLSNSCRFREAECRACGKVGHIARVCRSKTRNTNTSCSKHGQQKTRGKVHNVEEGSTPDIGTEPPSEGEEYSMFALKGHGGQPMVVTVQLNSEDFPMKVDTGAHCLSQVKPNSHLS